MNPDDNNHPVNNQQSINISHSQNVQIGDVTLQTGSPRLHQKDASPDSEVVKQLIADGKIREALEHMLLASKDNTGVYDQFTLLLGQLSKTETESRIGIIDKETERIQLARIAKAILDLHQNQ